MSQSFPDQLLPATAFYLRRFVRRRRRFALARAAAYALSIGMVWLLGWALFDRLFALPAAARIAVPAGLLCIWFVCFFNPALAMLRRTIDWRLAARQAEKRDFRLGESLATVVSQAHLPPSLRGSSAMLDHLAQQVETILGTTPDPVRVDPARSLVLAWTATVAIAGLACALAFWPWLGLPRLLARQITPWRNVAPVTTTQLTVTPGSAGVLPDLGVTIVARAVALDNDEVVLRMSSDSGQTWAALDMVPAADRTFSYFIPAIWRPTQYEVLAGDAVAGPFELRPLRPPLVHEFRIRLEYPRYRDRPARELSTSQGSIEAPVGTVADVTIVATEPLKRATFSAGGVTLDTLSTADTSQRRVRIPIASDIRYQIELVSADQISNTIPFELSIHALPDLPPVVAFMSPPADCLLLTPSQVLQADYQASNDNALGSLQLRIAVNGAARETVPLSASFGEPSRRGSVKIDLSSVRVQIGDLVSATLVATDRAGHESLSSPLSVFVAPQAILPAQATAVAKLTESLELGRIVLRDLDQAQRLLDPAVATAQAATRPAVDAAGLRRQGAARIASAADSSAALVVSLRAAASHAQPAENSARIGSLVATAQSLATRIDRANLHTAVAESISGARQDLQAARATLDHELLDPLLPLWRGLLAQQLHAQRLDLTALKEHLASAAPDSGIQALRQLETKIAAGVSQLGLDPSTADLDAKLTSLQMGLPPPATVPLTLDLDAHIPDQFPPASMPDDLDAVGGDSRQRGTGSPVDPDRLETVPPTYSQALHAYFEALDRSATRPGLRK